MISPKVLALLTIVSLVHSPILLAAAIVGTPLHAKFAQNGQYVIARYSGGNIFFWDLTRIWSPHKPTLVYGFNCGPSAISPGGDYLAYGDRPGNAIIVERLERNLPRLYRVPTEDIDWHQVSISPDGHRVLLFGNKRVDLILAEEQPRRLQRTFGDIVAHAVTFKEDLIALGLVDGSVQLIDTESLETVRTIHTTTDKNSNLLFTPDGKYLIIQGKPSQGESSTHLLVAVDETNATHKPKRADSFRDSWYLESGRFLHGDSGRTLWHINRDAGSGYTTVASLKIDGGLETRREPVAILTAPEDQVLDISERMKYVLTVNSRGYFLYDLLSGLPLFELNDGTRHLRYKGIPDFYVLDKENHIFHLRPKLGAEPLYRAIEKHSIERDSFKRLIYLARMTSVLKHRYDRVWFSLLTSFREDEQTPHATLISNWYRELLTLCRALIWLREIETADNPDETIQLAIDQLDALKKRRNEIQHSIDSKETDLLPIIAGYYAVIERDLWHALGRALQRTGEREHARNAFEEAIRLDPEDFHAHTALFALYADNPEKFERLVEISEEKFAPEFLVTHQIDPRWPRWFYLKSSLSETLELAPLLRETAPIPAETDSRAEGGSSVPE